MNLPNETYFFEDAVTVTENEVINLLKWIKQEILQLRTPFCWRQSYGRGVGKVLSVCEAGKEKIGALCYTPCPEGYSRQGTFDCQQICKAGWRDDGLFCRFAEYGRGAGYPWKFGDALNDNGMKSRCEADNKDLGCEQYGLIYYPKCRAGYNNFGCCICRPPTPNCSSEGYSSFGQFDLSCAVKIILGDPTVLQCKPEEEPDAGLCYPPCETGFNGVGPVCWQQCGDNQVNCGAGCASSESDCGFAVFEQVMGPLVVAANIATLGAAGVADAVADSIIVSNKVVKITSKSGRYFLKFGRFAVKTLQSVSPADIKKSATVFKRIKLVRAGTKFKKVKLAVKVSSQFYGAYTVGARAFANDFIEMTSTEIGDKLDSELGSLDAYYVKTRWADIQFNEMRESQAWAIADITLSVVGIADITGVTDLINAYAKPKCKLDFPFPNPTDETSNFPPLAVCKDITINVDINSQCQGEASALAIGGSSTDDSGADSLTYFIDEEKDIKTFDIINAPYTVDIEVEDPFGLTDTCKAEVGVIDRTPSTITCPQLEPQFNTEGVCGTEVVFDEPDVINNCQSTSTITQTVGKSSGSFFDVGVTPISYEIQDSTASTDSCNFKIIVTDAEKPSISCTALVAPVNIFPTDEGECTRVYVYTPPVGTDNCGATTYQLEGPPLSNPFVFPVQTTINTYVAEDPSGNEDACSFNVTIEDREDPTIECPPEVIRACFDTGPETAGTANTADNCDDVQAPVLSYSDDADDGIASTCPEITMRTWLSTDWKDNTANCTQRMVEVEPDALTDSTNCMLGSTFNTVFAPDLIRRPTYKLSSTSPGYFVYHVFHVGEPGEVIAFSIDVPYPFVTRGPMPVSTWDWLDIEPGSRNEACFLPKGNLFFQNDTQVTMSDYAGECGDHKNIMIEVLTPGTGFIHLAINLDFGLKDMLNVALGPWAQWVNRKRSRDSDKPRNNPATDALSKKLLLQDRCSFKFSSSGTHADGSRLLENINIWKRNQGVSGFVRDAFHNPLSLVLVSLHDGETQVGFSVTDQDGYYEIRFKATGGGGEFAVKLGDNTKTVYLKSGNGIGSVDFVSEALF